MPERIPIDEAREKIARAAYAVDETHARSLATMVDVIAMCRGCVTPPEEFLIRLLREYGLGSLTPEDVESALEEFRENLEMVAPAARNFARMYPELMQEPTGVPG